MPGGGSGGNWSRIIEAPSNSMARDFSGSKIRQNRRAGRRASQTREGASGYCRKNWFGNMRIKAE
jgi:hypothetical protein